MKLSQRLSENHVFLADNYTDTDKFYSDFSVFLKEKGFIQNSEKIKRLFIKRENIQTTAIGKKVATPHIFSDEFSDFLICVAFIRNGMEYKAPDKEKVTLVFLIMSDDRDVALHLKYLAHIAKLIQKTDIAAQFETQVSAVEIIAKISEQEKIMALDSNKA
jgi:PTS system nitrogen regulatory IIA component